jgi:hypothetical protein
VNKRLILAGLAATGGLLTTAFLQAAVAVADTADAVSATGADAFTIGSYTFDPFTAPGVEGWEPVAQLTTSPPLLELGGGTALGLPLAQQSFELFNSSGTDLGSIQGNETITSLFGLTNGEFTVAGSTPIGDATMPTDGTVYDVFNLGHGYENVYVATPDTTTADGATTPGTVTDTLITPTGKDIDLSSLFGFNAANPMNPGDAFTGLEVGNLAGAQDAFNIGGMTLDPINSAGAEGFNAVAPLATAAPLLELGGSSLGDPSNAGNDLATQSFDVLNSSGAEIGTINTGVDVTNLLGLTNTQLIVTSVTPTGDSTTGLPSIGSVYDAMNLGHGWENVYTATPGTDGVVTDTLITPNGKDIDLSSLFGNVNVANPLDPGAALTGLQAGDGAIGTDAFSIGGVTFDPTLASGAEGFTPVEQLLGAPPLLDLGGGTPSIFGVTLSLAEQNFNIYDGTSATDQIGSIATNDQVTNLLGLTNTEFTVTGATPLGDTPLSALPTEGTVYDVLNIGGIENVYTAIPGVNGAPDTITDTLVTRFGDIDLSHLVSGLDAIMALNPGDAFTAGLDLATSAASEAAAGAASAIDPLSLLGL